MDNLNNSGNNSEGSGPLKSDQISKNDPEITGGELPDDQTAASLVQNELADKNKEIAKLKAIIIQKEGQLNVYKYQSAGYSNKKQMVLSTPAFFSLLLVIILFGSIAVYSLFFSKPQTRSSIITYSDADSVSSKKDYLASTTKIDTAAFLATVDSTLNKGIDSILNKFRNEKSRDSDKMVDPAEKSPPAGEDLNLKKRIDKPKIAAHYNKPKPQPIEKEPEYTPLVKYSVTVPKAYFYDQPDVRTKRPLYLSADTGSSDLTASQEANGFVYVVFFNTEGQITKGWLRKQDLRISN